MPILTDGGSRFEVGGRTVELGVPGPQRANAAAAIAGCRLVGSTSTGRRRRSGGFTGGRAPVRAARPHAGGAVVYDDYAHHPTEVAATLAGRGRWPTRRLVAVFQPHLFSRTAQLAREFGAALAAATGRRRSTSTRRASGPRTSRG